jgi:hypothetical protein
MDDGGCLCENMFCQPVNLAPIFESLADEDDKKSFKSDESECCICFEEIGEKNNCTTECGHRFCFKCLVTAMKHNNTCPYCRTELIEEEEEPEYEDSEYEEEEEGEENEDNDSVDDNDYHGDVEDIADRLEQAGITLLDLTSMLLNKFSKKNTKYTKQFIANLWSTVDKVNDEVEDESIEREQMGEEDKQHIKVEIAV